MNVWTAEVRVIARACAGVDHRLSGRAASRAELESTNCATLGATQQPFKVVSVIRTTLLYNSHWIWVLADVLIVYK